MLLCILSLTIGCGVVKQSARSPVATAASDTTNREAASDTETVTPSPMAAVSIASINEARASLMQAYRDWKGTPYRLGGGSQSGVDCSMFINIVFAEYFNIDLPTNTRTQLNVGAGVRRAAIKTGDLIFFRTGRKMLHVGVMLNKEEFLHASTSKGVTISQISQKYWASRYLAARRVL
ncbi:NlpC/P60 family protein [Fodinibius sediminis]|nr:NlpC/P60 family protein [Fodinibius sediminis]